MRRASIGLGLIWLGCSLHTTPVLVDPPDACVGEYVIDGAARIVEQYGPAWAAEDLAREDVANALRAAENAIARYPAALCLCGRVNQVILVGRLHLSGTVKAIGYAHLPTRSIVVSLDSETERTIQRTLHHEWFHILDNYSSEVEDDEEWSALNHPEFSYGRDAFRAWGPWGDTSEMIFFVPGILTRYSATSPAHDRAELFSLINSYPSVVSHVARRDPVLARKVRALEQRIRSLCPGLPKEEPIFRLDSSV